MSESIVSETICTPSSDAGGDGGAPSLPAAQRDPAHVPVSLDEALIAIVIAPLAPGETAFTGFARKEAELRDVFATLGVLESRALYARLCNPRSDDPLAAAFSRLTPDRRARLIHFIGDARRRAALAGCR